MRSVVAILLLVLIVSTQTPAGQLLKLPLLIEHFIKHQKQDSSSLIGFLADHYTTHHNDADRPEDEQLPFKNSIVHSIGYAIVPSAIKANIFIPLPTDMKFSFLDAYVPQQHLTRIFHPPRV